MSVCYTEEDENRPQRLIYDQVTVDLDVLVRSNLIDFLVEESTTRGATVICEPFYCWSFTGDGVQGGANRLNIHLRRYPHL